MAAFNIDFYPDALLNKHIGNIIYYIVFIDKD